MEGHKRKEKECNALDNVNVVSYPPPDDKRTQRKENGESPLMQSLEKAFRDATTSLMAHHTTAPCVLEPFVPRDLLLLD